MEIIKNKTEDKVWGTALHVFASSKASMSHLHVKEGFRCSRHYHQWRANQFTVVSGQLYVEWWEGKKSCGMSLYPGETLVIPSGVVHRFNVMKSGHVIEVYWPDHLEDFSPGVSCEDIVRLDQGGKIE